MSAFRQFDFRDHPAFGQWYARANRHPSWVTRWALFAAVLAVVVPMVLLIVTAVVVGVIVFVMLSVLGRIMNLFATAPGSPAPGSIPGGNAPGSSAPGTEPQESQAGGGRQNVRVIQRP